MDLLPLPFYLEPNIDLIDTYGPFWDYSATRVIGPALPLPDDQGSWGPVGRVTRFHPNCTVPFVMTDPLPSNQVGLESVGPTLFTPKRPPGAVEPRGTGVI